MPDLNDQERERVIDLLRRWPKRACDELGAFEGQLLEDETEAFVAALAVHEVLQPPWLRYGEQFEETAEELIRRSVGKELEVADSGAGVVTGIVESADEHGYVLAAPAEGRYLLWANLLDARPALVACETLSEDTERPDDWIICRDCCEAWPYDARDERSCECIQDHTFVVREWDRQ